MPGPIILPAILTVSPGIDGVDDLELLARVRRRHLDDLAGLLGLVNAEPLHEVAELDVALPVYRVDATVLILGYVDLARVPGREDDPRLADVLLAVERGRAD